MKGQDDTDPSGYNYDDDSYTVKTPLQKIFILLAGPFANFLLAYLLYLAVALGGSNALLPQIGHIEPKTPAAQSELLKGDIIRQINGEEIRIWRELTPLIKQSEGTLELVVERSGTLQRLYITPELLEGKNLFGETVYKKMIGISPSGEITTIRYDVGESFFIAWERTEEAATLIVRGLEKLITGVISVDNVGGVVSIVQVTSQATEYGIAALLMLTALISVNLGVLNLLPIPALDGGHIMFNLYELITKRQPSEEALYRMTLAGWIFLGGLMLLGLYNDINRIIAG